MLSDSRALCVVARVTSRRCCIAACAYVPPCLCVVFALCSQVKLWDLRNLKNLHTLALPGSAAGLCVKFDHTGSFFAAGCGGGQAVVQAVKEWAPVATFEGHGKECTGLAFNFDATVLATCSLDRTVKLWGK